MRRKGPWSEREIERFLEQTRVPIRLACNGTSGHPVLASLWFAPLAGRLWCATQRNASVALLLAQNPRCGFEVAGDAAPYCGVRGQGLAALHDDRGEEILRILLERYGVEPTSRLARWLLARVATETAVAIEPRTLVSWDYRDRMSDAA